MEHIFAAIGIVAVIAVVAVVLGTLWYLRKFPETEMERREQILKRNALIESTQQMNTNNYAETLAKL